jgi:hypothetical protein
VIAATEPRWSVRRYVRREAASRGHRKYLRHESQVRPSASLVATVMPEMEAL